MRVAFLSQPFDLVLPPEQTSIGIWTYEVARRFAPDCETAIISRGRRGMPSAVGDWGRVDFVPSAPLRAWAQASRLWSRFRPPSAALVGQRFYAFDYLGMALKRLRALEPDVVHIQNFPHFAPAVRKALPDSAIVLHMHCDWLVDFEARGLARSLSAVDTVIGCSAHVATAAEERFKDLAIRFAVVPNGTTIEADRAAAPARDPWRVVFVGRVSPEKGVHTLLQAWPSIVAACPSAHLDIVGPPSVTPREFLADLGTDPHVRDLARFYAGGAEFRDSYASTLRAMVEPSIADTVTFVGHEPHERVMDRLASASVLVNPSLSESFGMSLIEALSVGTPVVATRAGGMPEILQATEGGALVERNDPPALAEAIIALLVNPERAAATGRRGAARTRERYSWDRIAALTRDVYNEALLRRRSVRTDAREPSSGIVGRAASPGETAREPRLEEELTLP